MTDLETAETTLRAARDAREGAEAAEAIAAEGYDGSAGSRKAVSDARTALEYARLSETNAQRARDEAAATVAAEERAELERSYKEAAALADGVWSHVEGIAARVVEIDAELQILARAVDLALKQSGAGSYAAAVEANRLAAQLGRTERYVERSYADALNAIGVAVTLGREARRSVGGPASRELVTPVPRAIGVYKQSDEMWTTAPCPKPAAPPHVCPDTGSGEYAAEKCARAPQQRARLEGWK